MSATLNASKAKIQASPDGNEGPHHMRYAEHTKMRPYIKYALAFLENNPDRPVVLHTLPLPPKPEAKQRDISSAGQPTASSIVPNKKRKLNPSTNGVASLVSVVEVIKREWNIMQKAADRRASKAPATELTEELRSKEAYGPLHQYNIIGTLEDLPEYKASAPPPLDLIAMLSGKNHIQIQNTPYMKVFLSRQPLPISLVGSATYQSPPPPPPKSRSAKSRERKRRRKLSAQNQGGANKLTESDLEAMSDDEQDEPSGAEDVDVDVDMLVD